MIDVKGQFYLIFQEISVSRPGIREVRRIFDWFGGSIGSPAEIITNEDEDSELGVISRMG